MVEQLQETLEHLSINTLKDEDDHHQSSPSLEQIILSSNVNSIRTFLSSAPSGLLITGSDRQTRRSLIRLFDPTIEITSACMFVINKSSENIQNEQHIICVDDVDFSDTVVEVKLKGLFPVTLGRGAIVIGLASSEAHVPSSLRRAGRFEIVHTVTPPSIKERENAWQKMLSMLSIEQRNRCPQSLCVHLETDRSIVRNDSKNLGLDLEAKELAAELAAISPSYHLSDFSQVVHEFLSTFHMTNIAVDGATSNTNGHDDNPTTSTNDQHNSQKYHHLIEYKTLLSQVKSHRPTHSSANLPFISTFSSSSSTYASEDEWGAHAGYSSIKKTLVRFSEWPVIHHQTIKRLHIHPPRGLLLHGPSGCGKTLLVRMFLQHRLRHTNHLWVSGNDLFCKYLGESEARVRTLFSQARSKAPCVIVIDDLNVVAAKRDMDMEGMTGSSGVERRVLAALLTELDGIQQDRTVFIIGCARDVKMLDEAVVRPGRLDMVVKVGLPDFEDRRRIVETVLEGVEVEDRESVVEMVASDMEGWGGAEIEGVCREAGMLAMEELEQEDEEEVEDDEESAQNIKRRHFEAALEEILRLNRGKI